MSYDPEGRGPADRDPKPFGKVRLTDRVSLRKVTPHDRFASEFTGRLDCTLRALTPIHVGSGLYELIRGDPVRGLITHSRRVQIPGSSLKGAIRSVAEAISYSCVRVVDRHKDIDKRLAVQDLRPCRKVDKRDAKKEQCICCSVFGGMGYQGRINFSDAIMVRGAPSLRHLKSPYPPDERAPGYVNRFGEFDGRKFYFHGVPVEDSEGEPYLAAGTDSEFTFRLHFESLSAEEFCLLLVAMGILDQMIIKLGGGRFGMLGSVEIYPDRLELMQPTASFTDFGAPGEVVDNDVQAYLLARVGEANGLVNEEALDQLMEVWEFPSARRAPTRAY
jgi:CRISPR-associated protein Csm3